MQRRPSVVWPLARTPHHESGRELVPGTDYPKASGSRRLDHRPHLGASSLPGPAGARRHGPALLAESGPAVRSGPSKGFPSPRKPERPSAARRPGAQARADQPEGLRIAPAGSPPPPGRVFPARPGWCSPAWPGYWQNPDRLCAPARAKISCDFPDYQFRFTHKFRVHLFEYNPISISFFNCFPGKSLGFRCFF